MTDKNRKKRHAPYINLCQDLMFKIYFSRSKPLLLSLINAFLPLPEGKSVKSLTILNPIKKEKGKEREAALSIGDSAIYPQFPDTKRVVLDLRARLNTGEALNVEMQTIRHESFLERMLYYWSRLYGEALEEGKSYAALHPAYSLVFADFPLFSESPEVVSSFSVRSDKPPHFQLSDHLRMVFVDLSKFAAQSGPGSLLDSGELWCYILKRARDMSREDSAVVARKGREMRMAMDHLKSLSQQEDVRYQEEAREKFYRDFVAGKEAAVQRSRREGLEEGLERGMEKGMEKGMERGMEKERRHLVLSMLQENADMSFICKVTGLSEEEIKKLQNGSGS